MKLTKVFQGLLIFVLLVGLISGIANMFNDYYDVEDTYYKDIDGKNNTLTGHFLDISGQINSSVSSITNGIQDIAAPSNPLDILGGLASLGIGILKTVWGVFSIPAMILDIIVVFYSFPSALITFITASLLVTLAFIVVRAYIKEDV